MITVMMSITFTLKAQYDIRASGGLNVVSLSNDYNGTTSINGQDYKTEVKARGGFNLGGSLTFGNRLYISPGFYWTSVNLNVVTESTNLIDVKSYENSPTVNMISVPLHIGVRFINPMKENLINARLFVGITGSHVIAVHDAGYTYTDASGKEVSVSHTKDDYENMITSFDMGLGIDIGAFFADAGYKIGMSTIFDEPGNNIKANMFYLNIGVKFSFFTEEDSETSF